MRGFRWQFMAFVLSLLVFMVALGTRLLAPAPLPPSPTPDVAVLQVDSTSQAQQPSATPSMIPPAIMQSTAIPAVTVPDIDDGVTTYTEALIGEVTRLNPILAQRNPVENDITNLIFDSLITINTFGEPVGELARRWVVSRDGLEYVFTLRNDVLWHDGTPFNADDVVYTMGLLSDPAFPGAPEIGRFWQTVEVQKLNEQTVRFRLTQPLSSFLTKLTIGILPEHALRGTTAQHIAQHPFNLTPVGTGPYQLESLASFDGTRIDAVNLRVAPVYRQRTEGQRPLAMQRVRFRLVNNFDEAYQLLQNGAVDGFAARQMSQRQPLIDLTNVEVHTAVAPAVGMLIYNWDESRNVETTDDTESEPLDIRFFSDPRARRALQTGLNRITPVETRLANQAVVADSPLLLNTWAYAALEWPEPDPLQAFSQLSTANIRTPAIAATEGDPDVFHRFNLLVRDEPALIGLAQEIAAQWQVIGLDVTVEFEPPDVYQARLQSGDFDTAIVELPLGTDPDVYAYWHIGQVPPDGLNYGHAADDRISEALQLARRDQNGLNRINLYRNFQQLFIDRAIALPLYYPLFTYAVRDNVEGVQLGFISSPEDRFRTIGEWSFRQS